ncbi:hypothetical protein CTAYLR_007934 [Chrysophaeum taylorii]|uniref:Uncharacterized protein n=1 Tax=Chrysophaeum taylorii TaxID=2483200 RepID=A0AAD7UBD8_9STRA|nr:hypothetical protein CTAYLR_007934 [Chrysophaeum taylorii]
MEAEVRKNPYSVRAWLGLVGETKGFGARRVAYERGVRFLPRSFKLWMSYLDEFEDAVRSPVSKRAEILLGTYERALVHLHKMPRIWLQYLGALRRFGFVGKAREAFDACLRALPITQHELAWPEHIEFATQMESQGIIAYRRYVMFDPAQREGFVEYLLKIGRRDDAARELAKCAEDDEARFAKSKHQLWMKLIDIASGDNVDAMIRSGLSRFTDQVGLLWCKLASYHVRNGDFEAARDTYDEAARTVLTVRDFSIVFDAYTKFEESVISATLRLGDDVEFLLARLERLVSDRPLLLSSVVLRQNPLNVAEWHARAALFPDDGAKRLETYAEAVKTVKDPKQSRSLWIAMAREYDDDLENARIVFGRALENKVNVYCAWAEMELEHDQFDAALEVVTRGLPERNSRVWALYLDLEESLGTFATAKAAYERALDLKVATPQTVLHFADFLQDRNYVEDMYKAFEKGLALFDWPHSRDLWLEYLSRAPSTGGNERVRDLYEQALAAFPSKHRKDIYVRYAQFEEQRSIRRALDVYERAATEHATFEAFCLWILKIEKYLGPTKARPVYEKAIKELDDDQNAKRMCLRLVNLELKLGEIDRARAVLAHGSQFAPTDDAYWHRWRDFEVAHGNEDTFRDMLRIKRSVETKHSIAYHGTREEERDDAVAQKRTRDEAPTNIQALEQQAIQQDTSSNNNNNNNNNNKRPRLERQDAPEAVPQARRADPNEIDLDDDDDDDDGDDGGEVQLQKKTVPQAVFGGLQQQQQQLEEGEPVGALARFKKKS